MQLANPDDVTDPKRWEHYLCGMECGLPPGKFVVVMVRKCEVVSLETVHIKSGALLVPDFSRVVTSAGRRCSIQSQKDEGSQVTNTKESCIHFKRGEDAHQIVLSVLAACSLETCLLQRTASLHPRSSSVVLSLRTATRQEPNANMATPSEKHPEVYVRGKVDPRQRVRTVPMEVLSLGYSRTGTMSTCLHMLSCSHDIYKNQPIRVA
jgi:hypothetical protein